MLGRDAHVARRNFVALLFQTFLQPLMFVFIFGRVMVGSGYMPPSYKSLLLPGIMAICMVGTGIWAVAMPLIAEFQFTREIEDRLLAPMEISWLAIEKVVAGTLQALAAGFMVIPAAWLLLRPGVGLNITHPLLFAVVALLVALFSATGGLALGCSMQQTHIGLMFSLNRGAHDLLWLHLLSLERARKIPHPAKGRAGESPGLRQRRSPRHHGAAVFASATSGCPRGIGFLQRCAPRPGPKQVPRQIRYLSSLHFD